MTSNINKAVVKVHAALRRHFANAVPARLAVAHLLRPANHSDISVSKLSKVARGQGSSRLVVDENGANASGHQIAPHEAAIREDCGNANPDDRREQRRDRRHFE